MLLRIDTSLNRQSRLFWQMPHTPKGLQLVGLEENTSAFQARGGPSRPVELVGLHILAVEC